MTKPDLDSSHPWNVYVERKRAQWASEETRDEARLWLGSSLHQAADDCDCAARCNCGFGRTS